MHKTKHIALIGIFFLLVVACPAWAAENPGRAEKLMNRQLQAIVENNAPPFVENGNRAFKEMMADFIFESFTMQYGAKLKQGYRLHYLSIIKRLGMDEDLWRISITDDTYELFGSITLAKEVVVGFKLK